MERIVLLDTMGRCILFFFDLTWLAVGLSWALYHVSQKAPLRIKS